MCDELICCVINSDYSSTLFRMDLLGACSRIGAKRSPSLKCHIYFTMMKLGTVIPYLKKIQKHINHVIHPLNPANISIFHRKSAIALYQEIWIWIAFKYKISNSFNFFRAFKGCFNKHGCNFDHVSKIGYSRPS